LFTRWLWEGKPLIDRLKYIVKDRGITLPKNTISDLLQILVNKKYFQAGTWKKGMKQYENYKAAAEWLAAQGCQCSSLMHETWYTSFLNLIPRIIADGCNLPLIQILLAFRKQSECSEEQKKEYDNILLVAARKGRVDVLDSLVAQGCKYTWDVNQKALFNAPIKDRGHIVLILSKMLVA
jgi:hypothetical protein